MNGLGGVNADKSDDVSSLLVAAHELKSPLAVMRQLSLYAQLPDVSGVRRQQALAQIQLIAEKGLRLTGDLTKTARLDATQLLLEPVNVAVVCERVVKDASVLYREYGKTIRLRRHRSSPLVLAHYEYLQRIIHHFSDNALHYSDEDGVVEISFQTKRQDRTVRVGVRDYGPAIPLSVWRTLQKRVAQPMPFHARPESSGLGLSISQQFAAAIGGKMGVIRHRDGVTFFVDVPLSEQLSLL